MRGCCRTEGGRGPHGCSRAEFPQGRCHLTRFRSSLGRRCRVFHVTSPKRRAGPSGVSTRYRVPGRAAGDKARRARSTTAWRHCDDGCPRSAPARRLRQRCLARAVPGARAATREKPAGPLRWTEARAPAHARAGGDASAAQIQIQYRYGSGRGRRLGDCLFGIHAWMGHARMPGARCRCQRIQSPGAEGLAARADVGGIGARRGNWRRAAESQARALAT